MTTHTSGRRRKRRDPRLISTAQREQIVRHFPLWLFGAVMFALIFPRLMDAVADGVAAAPGAAVDVVEFIVDTGADVFVGVADGVVAVAHGIGDVFVGDDGGSSASGQIAPLFTREIVHWEDDIMRWATEYDLDPNLLATVMQIESCGHPTVSSVAGAQGLFQVMPFHFSSSEDQLDPDTNAMRGANVLNTCLDMANGDPGMAMACYNGGPSVLYKDFSTWLSEPQRYYRWGTGIYGDAQQSSATSPTLDAWLNAGGATLCQMASNELGI